MTDISKSWEKLSSKNVHTNPYFKVRRDEVIKPSGKRGEYFVVANSPSVFVLALTEARKLVFIKLFRYTTQKVSVEVPAGGTDGEDPLIAAKRELQEETGYEADTWKHLGQFQGANGVSDQMVDIYLATKLEQTDEHDKEEEGIGEVLELSLDEIKEKIKSGEVSDLQTMGALLVGLPFLENI